MPPPGSLLQEFLDTLKPMHAAKVRNALQMRVRVNGQEFLTRQALIERCFSQGYKVTTRKNGERVFMALDGSWFDSKAITISGLNYAEHLQNFALI